MFQELFGAEAVLLLTFLLLVSTVIALYHRKRINTANDFLIANHKGTWYDFASSQIAYAVGVSSAIIFFPSLTYQYGPIAIPIVLIGLAFSLLIFGLLVNKSTEVKKFLKTNYGLPNFISQNFQEGKGRNFVLFFSSVIIALVYWALFGFELLALKVLFGEMFPQVSSLPILVIAFGLVIVYVNIGGFLSTMRTDFVQTLMFMLIICFFSFSIFPQLFAPDHSIANIFSSEIFSTHPNVSSGNILFFAITWFILAFAFPLTSQDQWSRGSAVSKGSGAQKAEHRNTYIGLTVSILGFIPYVAIFMMGLWMFAINPSLSGAGVLQTIPAKLINSMAGKAPVGLFIPVLIAIAISTADTALITSTQVIGGIKKKWCETPTSCRIVTLILGLLGIITALLFPDIISGVWALVSLPVIFLPLVLARIWNRGHKTWVAVVVLIVGTVIGLGAGMAGGEIAAASPLLVLIIPIVLYPLLHLVPIGGKSNVKR